MQDAKHVTTPTYRIMLDKFYGFLDSLSREEFYDLYTLVKSMKCDVDAVLVDGVVIDIKQMVRRIRITLMGYRFNVDCAKSYTKLDIDTDISTLVNIYYRGYYKGEMVKLIYALTVLRKYVKV